MNFDSMVETSTTLLTAFGLKILGILCNTFGEVGCPIPINHIQTRQVA